jgi:hypothetical protein
MELTVQSFALSLYCWKKLPILGEEKPVWKQRRV